MRYVAVVGALLAAALGGTVSAQPDPSATTEPVSMETLQRGTRGSIAKMNEQLNNKEWTKALDSAHSAGAALDQSQASLPKAEAEKLRGQITDGVALARAELAHAKKVESQDLLDMHFEIDKIKHDRALTFYRVAMENAEKALHVAEWDKAIKYAEEALWIVEQNRAMFRSGEASDLRTQATAIGDKIRLGSVSARSAKMTAVEQAELSKEVDAAVKRRQLKVLRENAASYISQRRYIDAIDSLKGILQLEPNDAAAKSQLKILENTDRYRMFDKLNQVQAQENTKQSLISKEATIPYADVLSYPENWVEITRLRQQQ